MTTVDANLKIANIQKHANKSLESVPQELYTDLRPVKLSNYDNIREEVFWTLKNFTAIFSTVLPKNIVSSQVMCVNKALLFHEYKSYNTILGKYYINLFVRSSVAEPSSFPFSKKEKSSNKQ